MGKKLTTEEFIAQAKKMHGDKYDYTNVVYTNSRTKVNIYCKSCNKSFNQLPCRHLSGNGCKSCALISLAKSRTFNTDEFISKAKIIHHNKYNYTQVEYVNAGTKVKIICNTCNTQFIQNPNSHLLGKGCKRCSILNLAKTKLISKTEFINKANLVHHNIYDYTQCVYTNITTKIHIYCKHCHNYFYQTPSSHLQGVGCPTCKLSKGEREIMNTLNTLNIPFISQHKFNTCRNKLPLPFDFYLPTYNMCIEYDGILHFKAVKYFGGVEHLKATQYNDNIKSLYCVDNHIKLIRIPYTELKNIENIIKREVV